MSKVQAPPVTSKIGPVAGITDRTQAQFTNPVSTNPSTGGETRSKVATYFTRAPRPGEPTDILYNGDRQWLKLTLVLQTAGPVAVGTSSKIVPVLSGQGVLLNTGVPFTLIVAKGTRVYIAATGVNRVLVQEEPLPWLEQITASIGNVVAAVSGLFAKK